MNRSVIHCFNLPKCVYVLARAATSTGGVSIQLSEARRAMRAGEYMRSSSSSSFWYHNMMEWYEPQGRPECTTRTQYKFDKVYIYPTGSASEDAFRRRPSPPWRRPVLAPLRSWIVAIIAQNVTGTVRAFLECGH